MAKKLSRRPLKRTIRVEIQLGPYSTAMRDGKERPAQSYVLWTAQLPRGKKSTRHIAVVQKVTRRGNLGDLVHNPILFQKIVLSPTESTGHDVLNRARHAMYWLIHDQLARVTRPMVRARGEGTPEWVNFDVGGCAETLGAWRAETLAKIGTRFIGCWNHPIEPFGYMGCLEPKS
jgi:hypothetical protein